MTRLGIVTTHPIQYNAPWFRYLARQGGIYLRVFYLWDFGVRSTTDLGFGCKVKWDIPLLDGYAWELVANSSKHPGTHTFWGINNPDLAARLTRFDPTAILCIGYNYAAFVQLILTWNTRRCPLILRGDSHRLVPRRGPRAWAKRKAIASLFKRFHAFLYVGAANRDYYLHHDVPKRCLYFSPHAVDNSRFISGQADAARAAHEWKKELGIPEHHRVILFAGKFEPKKRPQDLIRAFHQAGLVDCSLLLIGSGELEERLRSDARHISHIVFAPFQNQSQMPRAYAAADLVVLPSMGSQETWGLCINEAMCLGKPAIVSSHVGCARDLVRHGWNGLVFEAGNVESLSACLQQALSDPARLRAWGQAGRSLIESYSYAEATAGLERALADVTTVGRTSAPCRVSQPVAYGE